jgi:hypothetical protein
VPWPALNYEYKTLIKLYNFSEPCQSYQQGTNRSLEIAIQAELARNLKVTAFNPAPAIITVPVQLTLGLERHPQRHIRELSSSIMAMQYPAAHWFNFIVGGRWTSSIPISTNCRGPGLAWKPGRKSSSFAVVRLP